MQGACSNEAMLLLPAHIILWFSDGNTTSTNIGLTVESAEESHHCQNKRDEKSCVAIGKILQCKTSWLEVPYI